MYNSVQRIGVRPNRRPSQSNPSRPIIEALEARLLMSGEPLLPGAEFLGLGNYTPFGMEIESAMGDFNEYTVTTTGATYVLYGDGMDLYRRIDPQTNALDLSNEGKGRLVATLEFDADVGDLTLDFSDSSRVIIEGTTATFDFQSDSFFFVTAKESFSLTHNNLIVDAPYVAPLDPEIWDLDRMWTDGYGGSILASLSQDTEGVVISEDVNSTTIGLSVGDQTAHMAFPTKAYDFEGLYGQEARPFVQFVFNPGALGKLMQPGGMDKYIENGFGVFMLWSELYDFDPDQHVCAPILRDDGYMGYEFAEPELINSFVTMAHDNGFKVITYISQPSGEVYKKRWTYPSGPLEGQHQDITVTAQFMRDFQEEYDLDGWYFDNAQGVPGELLANYEFIRQVRTDVGAEGILYNHDSVDIWDGYDVGYGYGGLRGIMIDIYVDYTMTGETGDIAEIDDVDDPYLRYFATGYGITQTYSTLKLKSDGQTAISEAEKDRLFGQNLHGTERMLDDTWLNYFKPGYDIRAHEYRDPNIEFDPDVQWPLAADDWFRQATNVSVTNITHNSVTVTWTTDAEADSTVSLTDSEQWWPVEVLAGEVTDSDMATTHTVTISSLNPETTYEFRIRSANGETDIPGQIVWGYVGSLTTASAPEMPPVTGPLVEVSNEVGFTDMSQGASDLEIVVAVPQAGQTPGQPGPGAMVDWPNLEGWGSTALAVGTVAYAGEGGSEEMAQSDDTPEYPYLEESEEQEALEIASDDGSAILEHVEDRGVAELSQTDGSDVISEAIPNENTDPAYLSGPVNLPLTDNGLSGDFDLSETVAEGEEVTVQSAVGRVQPARSGMSLEITSTPTLSLASMVVAPYWSIMATGALVVMVLGSYWPARALGRPRVGITT